MSEIRSASAQNVSSIAWKDCRSDDANKRLTGCTAVINAHGFGSQSRLADALDGRCWAYHVKGQFALAIADCGASISLRPRYPYAHNNLGTAYAGLGDYKNALTAFNVAIELKPEFYWSRFNRAKALIAIGRKEDTVADYEYLLKRDPANQEVRNLLDKIKAELADASVHVTSPSPAPPISRQTAKDSVSVAMQQEGGIFVIPVLINNAITLDFVVDSGAADVNIPADVVMTLMRTGTIRTGDFLEQKTYVLADGTKVPSQTFRIRSLKVGNKIIENVNGSVAPVQGSLLLGQSFLSRFKSWSIDNANHSLILE